MVERAEIKETNEVYYAVFVDNSRRNGILHFTKEATVYFREYSKDVIVLSHADIITSGGWFDYSYKEMNIFDEDEPGIIDSAIGELKDYLRKNGKTSRVVGLEALYE